MVRMLTTIACSLVLLTLLGCGGNPPPYTGETRFPIKGKVTFQGEPVNSGTIALIPEVPTQNPCGGEIVNGEYSIPDVKGPNKGSYQVQVFWYKPTGKKIKDADTGEEIDEVEQVIPAKFNGATEISTTIDGANEALNFDLQ